MYIAQSPYELYEPFGQGNNFPTFRRARSRMFRKRCERYRVYLYGNQRR